MPHEEHSRWSRRGTLQLLGSAVVFPLAKTAAGSGTTLGYQVTETDNGLLVLCRSAMRDPVARDLGRCRGGSTDLRETALRARIHGASCRESWRKALAASAREDIAQGRIVQLDRHRISVTEADFLGLGAALTGLV